MNKGDRSLGFRVTSSGFRVTIRVFVLILLILSGWIICERMHIMLALFSVNQFYGRKLFELFYLYKYYINNIMYLWLYCAMCSYLFFHTAMWSQERSQTWLKAT